MQLSMCQDSASYENIWQEMKGQPRVTWRNTIWRDIKTMDTAWENVCLKTLDRDVSK